MGNIAERICTSIRVNPPCNHLLADIIMMMMKTWEDVIMGRVV